MTPTPRVIENLDNLRTKRISQLSSIFHKVAYQGNKIQIFEKPSRGDIIYGISDGFESGTNYTDWRFRTIGNNIRANYHEIWTNNGRDKYFLNRSYFHLYQLLEFENKEIEYILLHCDASEPDGEPHSIYKQSPHMHIEVAEHPLPKAHLALYNGRVKSILKNLDTFNNALNECITMIDDQIIQLHYYV